MRDTVARERTIGEVLDILVEAGGPDGDSLEHEAAASDTQPNSASWQRWSKQQS
jgi:hypothetical protein